MAVTVILKAKDNVINLRLLQSSLGLPIVRMCFVTTVTQMAAETKQV